MFGEHFLGFGNLNINLSLDIPSKIEWDRIPTDPGPSKLHKLLLDTQVFSGSVKRGPCWRFLGYIQNPPVISGEYVCWNP